MSSNSGDHNSGYYNSGNYNSGNCNSGDCNSGYYNSGDRNSGYYNSGNYNSGDRNSGYYNSGYYNSGDHNSGDRNSGHCNSGKYNSGNRNSGDYNSGDYNSGHYNSGLFNTDEPFLRMFNKETNIKRSEFTMPYIDFELTKWDDKQQALITYTYKEAWANAWNKASEITKQTFLDLPNFDKEIFKEITGIDVDEKVKIEVEGKVVYISKESAKALNLI